MPTTTPPLLAEGASVLWLDHHDVLAERSHLADLATTLRARGATLWTSAPGARTPTARVWSEEEGQRADDPTTRQSLETLLREAEIVVLPAETPSTLTRLVLAMQPPGQRLLVGFDDRWEARADRAREMTLTMLQQLGRADDPTLTVVGTSALGAAVTAAFGVQARPLLVGPALAPFDAERETPFPPPPLVPVRVADDQVPPRLVQRGHDGMARVLVDRRTGRPPRESSPYAGWWWSAQQWAILAQDAATFHELRAADPPDQVPLGWDDVELIARQASRATLALDWVQAALRTSAAFHWAHRRFPAREALLVLRLRELHDGIIPSLLPPDAVTALDAEIEALRAKVPGWQRELDQYFHGETLLVGGDPSEIRTAVTCGILALPVPPRTPGARRALVSPLFWVAAALEHGSLARAIAVMRQEAGLAREVSHVAVREAMRGALRILSATDPLARTHVVDLAERGTNAHLRELGRKVWTEMTLLPETLTAETLERLDGGGRRVTPHDLAVPGRAGALRPPDPAEDVPTSLLPPDRVTPMMA